MHIWWLTSYLRQKRPTVRPLAEFPAELIELIGDASHSQSDLLALSQTSRRIYDILEPRFVPFNIKHHRCSGLRWAAGRGDIALVKAFLRRPDVDVNIRKFGNCLACNTEVYDMSILTLGTKPHAPLRIAIEAGHEDIAVLLLDHGADLRWAAPSSPASLLIDVAWRGQVSLARKMIEMGVESPYPTIAVNTGNVPMFELLLAAWEKHPSPLSPSAMSYLLDCAVKRGHKGIVQALLARGAHVDGVSLPLPRTHLYDAIEGRKTELFELLLEHGANLCHHLLALECTLEFGDYPLLRPRGDDERRRDIVRVLRKASTAIQDHKQREMLDKIFRRWE